MMAWAHVLAVLGQFSILAATAAGWGYWIGRLAGLHRPLRPEDALLCGLAGLGLGWVLLQDLLYADLRLRYGAWLGAAAAAAGLALLLRRRPSVKRLLPPFALLVAAFGFQAWGLICQGPANYYGYGTQDQANYVDLAQFLIEKPYSLSLDRIGPHPWLVKAIHTKDQRIGEAVANADLAVLSGTDAESAYGATSVFLVSLTALAVYGLLMSLGAGPPLAWVGGLWAAVLPAVTRNHLDGFFSQAATLFVLPAVALAIRVAPRRPRLALVAAPLLLAFLFSTYTEIFVLVWAAALALVAVMPHPPSGRSAGSLRPPRPRVCLALACTVAPLVLLPTYFWRGLHFIRDQYRGAEDPMHLAGWMPRAGTWRGWAEVFLVGPKAHPRLVAAATATGMLLVLLMGAGALRTRSRARRRWLLAFAAVPLAVLLVLLFRRPFAPYPFGKLCVTFSPVAVVLATLGLARLFRPLGRRGAPAAVAALAFLGAWASLTKLDVVVAGGAGLRSVAFPAARATYRELEAHPERRYSIVERHFIINTWLCYYAREAEVYTPLSQIGDIVMSPSDFAFRRPPPADGKPLWLVSVWGVSRANR